MPLPENNSIAMANYQLSRKPAAPIIRDAPIRTPAMDANVNSARIVRALRTEGQSFISPKRARELMLEAAAEIERLQQLPLFP
jgi:hypothetical protein